MYEDNNNDELTKENKVFIAIFSLTGAMCLLKALDSEFTLYEFNFSWWWCFIPIWGSIGIVLLIYIIAWILDLMIGIEMEWQRKKRIRKFKKGK